MTSGFMQSKHIFLNLPAFVEVQIPQVGVHFTTGQQVGTHDVPQIYAHHSPQRRNKLRNRKLTQFFAALFYLFEALLPLIVAQQFFQKISIGIFLVEGLNAEEDLEKDLYFEFT